MTELNPKKPQISVDLKTSFVIVDNVKICKVVDGKLQFKDKDRRRASERGTPYVEVGIQELSQIVNANSEQTRTTPQSQIPPQVDSTSQGD